MKKYVFFLWLAILFSSSTYANLYSYLWVANNHAKGELSYTGPSQTSIIRTLSEFYTGTMSVAYVDCSTTEHQHIAYSGVDLWIFIPSYITINGKIFVIIPETPSGYTSVGQLPGGEYVFNRYTLIRGSGSVIGKCSAVGYTWPTNYTYPAISIKAKISELPAGTYTGTFPVRVGFGEYHSGFSAPEISRFPATLAYEHSTVLQVPYNINITNTCQVSPSNITIDHGRFSMGQGNGNLVKKDISVICEGDAQFTIDFQPLTAPTKSYKNGVGVGLGHGFDAVVQIGNLGLSSASTAKTIQVQKGVTTMPLTSTIHENDNSSVGTLYGAANLNLTMK